MQPNIDFYDPSTPEGSNDGVVLKPIVFKPLKNIKTGKFFSYAFALMERNDSTNSSSNMHWVERGPDDMMRKINVIRDLHQNIVERKAYLKKNAKKLPEYKKDEVKEEIAKIHLEIDEVIYPEKDRVYVESKEAKRFRLEQQNELTLDAASIAALRGDVPAPMGSTADASITQAKLENAEQRIADMEEQDNAEMDEMKAKMAEMQLQLDKPPSRRGKGFKPEVAEG